MPDNEAVEKIKEIIDLAYKQDSNEPDAGTIDFVEFWSNQAITKLERLGYRKQPSSPPPVLSDEEAMEYLVGFCDISATREDRNQMTSDLLQAQIELLKKKGYLR